MEDLRFPIGKYEAKPFTEEQLQEWINDIKRLPVLLENAVLNMDEARLNAPYRLNGWTIKQVVHHVADSHMNAYIRFKLGLTENNPVIKPYEQDLWAEMSDTRNLPINISNTILHAVHARWVEVLVNIRVEEWQRTVYHPEHKMEMTLWYLLGMYAWHSKHHTAHINSLRNRMNW